MTRNSAFCLIIAAVATLGACNSSDEEETLEPEVSSSTLVKSFSLVANSKVLPNLDKVFFSIDLNTARIFNADSMPYGTDISHLVTSITTDNASLVELHAPRPNASDSVTNYLENSTDSIDFSNGPVKLIIRSANAEMSMTYTIDVNVHKVKADSLSWGDVAYSKLPSALPAVESQQTALAGSKLFCLTTDGSSYSIASTDDPADGQWDTATPVFAFTPRVETLRGADDGLYILAADRTLYKSTDGGLNWTSTSKSFDYLIGSIADDMLATATDGAGNWTITAVNSGRSISAPIDFPVTGTSLPVSFTFPLSTSAQTVITGGRLASGELSADSWGFDGENWAKITGSQPLPYAMEGVAVAPYFTARVNSNWLATDYFTLVAFGGTKADGTLNDTVYYSQNYGMDWRIAPETMQQPTEMPAMTGSQAFVFESEMGTRANSLLWTSVATKGLPPVWMEMTTPRTRASEIITEWECPYIYLFGGRDASGRTCDTIWRGVIRRYTFKPLQ